MKNMLAWFAIAAFAIAIIVGVWLGMGLPVSAVLGAFGVKVSTLLGACIWLLIALFLGVVGNALRGKR